VEQVTAGGLRIAYRRAGEGPPLVLLHGGLGDSREWRRQFDGLSSELDVVAWDAPGCGRTSDPPESFRLPDFADCLAAFIDALGLEGPHVAGLSFGSGIALELYRRHPEIPRTLVLASGYAGWAGSLPPAVVEERLQGVLRDVELPPETIVANWLPTLFAEGTPPEVIDEEAAIMTDYHPAGARSMARSFAEADLRDVLPRIEVPTLLLYGDADERSPLSVAEQLHAGIPTSRLVVLPGIGHMINLEAPERFNDELREFVRST
jgi:pimeloyl-ACP methyl ester carboxylesterase